MRARNGKSKCKKRNTKDKATSYRLKCTKTANGLSHFVMYGDVSKKDILV